MWKRIQGHVRDGHFRDKDRQIGAPVLVETTYDEDQLRHMSDVTQAQNASYNNYASPAPQSYANLPPPQYGHQYRTSEVPTVSSVYSQPSPELRYDRHRPSEDQPFDISPPSSPEPDHYQQNTGQPRRFRSMRDVSPVDENRGQPMLSPQGGSHIPVMRKAPPTLHNQDSNTATQKFWGGKVPANSKVLWDEYSGEPTSSNAGKAARVTPGSYQKSSASPPSARLRETGYDVSITAGSRRNQSLAERANRYGTKPAPVDTRPREPWSRATGRAEIARPFKDQPSDKPLQIKKKDNSRAAKFEKDAPDSLSADAARVSEPADTMVVADSPTEHNTHEEPIKPIVPLKVARTSQSRDFSSPTSPQNPSSFNPYTYSPVTPTSNQPSGPTNEPLFVDDLQQQYNLPAFPPPSPIPPLPTSRVPSEPVSAANAILSRKRPTQVPDRVPARKPIASSVASTAAPTAASTARNTMISSGPPSPRPDSTFSTSTRKDLPRPPTELQAVDHIEVLESQMEDLKVRRNNVYRLLNDLNNMAPPNPMVTDFKRMRIVEQRKKDFEGELAEIKREEHDVGLKLHRAWRKRESADPGSESAFWVRRVTR
ncbi:hypothetical protein GRF29_112g284280 [Pseudopithomyces chartarum]|uniref:Uncharacterized protein n=1 Tax=Pseudopithomyces chartarum TaxID=1892770 RepID=A0AAN6LRI3_9PLEO|nr:hypothetical protein GRF29_112g284280 [Pseudopithomyces chartarum]